MKSFDCPEVVLIVCQDCLTECYTFALDPIPLCEDCQERIAYEIEAHAEDMDGDMESGLASAGFGTDEDYGCFGQED